MGPLLGLVATAGVAIGLVMILDDRFATLLRPDKGLGAMQCGVYQDPADPTVQLTDAEIWDAAGTYGRGVVFVVWGCMEGLVVVGWW